MFKQNDLLHEIRLTIPGGEHRSRQCLSVMKAFKMFLCRTPFREHSSVLL